MRKLSIIAAAAVVVAFAAGGAQAQCDFVDAAKAKILKLSMVRNFARCPSATFTSPNTSTGGGTPGCAPPFAHSNFQFQNGKGGCSISNKAKLEVPCKNGFPGNCTNLQIKAKCKGLLKSDGSTPDDSSNWTLSAVAVTTLDDPTNGDMTIIDFPVQVPFPDAKKGGIKLKTDSNAILGGLGLDPLPPCASITFLTTKIQDPTGQPFATFGVGARPKGL